LFNDRQYDKDKAIENEMVMPAQHHGIAFLQTVTLDQISPQIRWD